MSEAKQEKFENSLIEFVERASKEKATPEEIAVLPDVAKILRDIIYPR